MGNRVTAASASHQGPSLLRLHTSALTGLCPPTPTPETAPPLAGAFQASRSISEIQSKAGSSSHSERGQGAAPSPSLPTPRVTPASQWPLPTEHLFPGDRNVRTARSPRGLGLPCRPGGWTSPQAQLLQGRVPTNLPSPSLPPAHMHLETAAGCPFTGLFTFMSEVFQPSRVQVSLQVLDLNRAPSCPHPFLPLPSKNSLLLI